MKFINLYGLTLNENQRAGSAWDAELPNGERVEFKADLAAKYTGNTFIETRYSNDKGVTWKPSGFSLAKKQAQWWVIQVGVGTDYLWITIEALTFFIKEGPDYPVKGIRKGINGNSSFIKCEGIIVPLKDIQTIAVEAPVSKIIVDKPNPFS